MLEEVLKASKKNIYTGSVACLTVDGKAKVAVSCCHRGNKDFESKVVTTSTIQNRSVDSLNGCYIINTRNSKYFVGHIMFP